MRYALLIGILCLLSFPAFAQFQSPATSATAGGACTGSNFILPDVNGHILQCVGGVWTVVTNNGGTIYLGTSAAVTNPQRNGDPTTGLFSPAVDNVAIATGGAESFLMNSAGMVAIGPTVTSVTTGTALDLSTATNSFLLPIGTTGQRPTGVNGMIRYNSTLNTAEGFINGAWTSLGGSGSIYLGTSSTAANPQISGDATSGFYTPTASTVAVTAGGVEVMQWNSLSSGVDYLSITPGKSGTAPTIAVAGSTVTQGLNLSTKNTAAVNITSANGGLELNGMNKIRFPTSDTTTGGSIAIGSSALAAQTSSAAYGNTAVGYQSIKSGAGPGNTAFGYQALISGATAASTAIGYQALYKHVTGSGETAVGYQALYNDNGANNDNTAVGYQALYSVLDNNGQLDAAFGYQALYSGDGNQNSAFGYQALYASAGYGSTAIGMGALSQDSSSGPNTAVGVFAGGGIISGTTNVAVGDDALAGGSGSYSGDTAVGSNALVLDYSTGPNTGVGWSAIYAGGDNGAGPFSVTGTDNVAVGAATMGYHSGAGVSGSYNVALGDDSLTSITTGGNNTALGDNALINVHSGSNNASLGAEAGSAITTGSNNVTIGPDVGYTTLATGSYNILIGTSSSVDTISGSTSFELNIGNAIIVDMHTPTIASGFGTSPSVTHGTSNAAFTVNVGTGGSASSGVISFTNTANGWLCDVTDTTSYASYVTVSVPTSPTSVTLYNYSRTTGLATAWAASDILGVKCNGY